MPTVRLTQQPLSVRVMPPRINVPTNELQGQDSRTRLFLFLGLFIYFDSRGSLAGGEVLRREPSGGDSVDASAHAGECWPLRATTSGPADLELHSELLHLYGAAYNKASGFATYGGGFGNRRKYLPYGSAVLHLVLTDKRKGRHRLVWEATLNGSYLPDASDAELANTEVENAATLAAVAAYRELLSQLPARLAPIAARLGGRPTGRPLPPETFYLARLLPDARYVERAAISTRNGQVLHSEIQIRKEPIFSARTSGSLIPIKAGTSRTTMPPTSV